LAVDKQIVGEAAHPAPRVQCALQLTVVYG
jgi:hypothetical protein